MCHESPPATTNTQHVKAGETRVSSKAESTSISESSGAEFGANAGLVDELYEQYLKDRNAVDPAWWDFFEGYTPAKNGGDGAATPSASATSETAAPAAAVPAPAAAAAGAGVSVTAAGAGVAAPSPPFFAGE